MSVPQTYQGKPLSFSWPYTIKGEEIGAVARYEDEAGKVVIPMFKANGKGWTPGAPDEPRSLYGVDSIISGKAAFIVEGEKCAAALHSLGLCAVTSQGGCKAADKSNWEPVQAAKTIYLLPDNDAPGTAYMQAVAALVSGDNLQSVSLQGLPDKGDVVDFLQCVIDGWDGLSPIPEQQRETALNALRHAVKEHAKPYKSDQWAEIIPLPARGDLGDPAPYPIKLLPGSIQTAASEISRFSMVPPESPAVVGISTLAVAIGKKAVVVERRGHTHYAALFLALIATSGERKSPAFKNMTSALADWVDAQMEEYESLKCTAIANNDILDAQKSGLKGLAKKEGADAELLITKMAELDAKRLIVPPYPSLYTTDTTEERLFQKMHDRGGAYAVMSGEGRPIFDAIAGKYSGDKTGDAIYLSGISGDTITRDRVGGDAGPEERVIQDPCLNVCAMVQPDKYMEAANNPALRASGALARIWPIWLPQKAGTRIESEDDEGLDDAKLVKFNKLVKSLLEHKREEEQKPHKAGLSSGAAKSRRDFHNAIEIMLLEGGDLEDVRDIASKAVSQTCKLALVLHIASDSSVLDSDESTISKAIWATAQAMGTYHLTEAVRVQRLADEDPVLEQARKTLSWIKRERLETVSSTVITQLGPRPRPKAAQASVILDLLAEHNYLVAKKEPGKKRPVYTVNPALFSQISQISRGKHS